MRPRTDRLRRSVGLPSQWEIEYETHEQNFVFTFLSDGSGTCRDVDYGETVSFSWKSSEAPLTNELERTTFLEALAEELFWSEINEQLGEDAVISDSEWAEDFGENKIEFTCGSRDELERLTGLILHSFPSIWYDGEEQRTITFRTEGNHSGESARLEEDGNLELGCEITASEQASVVELLTFAMGQNTPVGEELEYNDGPSNRRSGYSWYSKSLEIVVLRPSFHEMAEARSRLREELKLSLSKSDLDRLLPVGGQSATEHQQVR